MSMQLVLDVDQTLLFSFPSYRDAFRRPVNVRPDATIRLSEKDTYDLYLRPDIDLLRDIPFIILSTGGSRYVREVADVLAQKGFPVEVAYDAGHLPTSGDPKPPITEAPALLIDDLETNLAGVSMKLAVLPRGVHCRVDAWTEVGLPRPEERRPGETFKEWVKRPRSTILELVRSGDSVPLGDCLRRYS